MPEASSQQHITREEFETFKRDLANALSKADPVLWSLLTAPMDDEPYTEEQQREDAEAHAAFERGEGISFEDIKREFGL
jgi:hypothetical protein